MTESLRLMAILAHPDDESLGVGGILAKSAAEGMETYVLTATRGQMGRFHPDGSKADPTEVGRVREAELRSAAAALGVSEVRLLGYVDGSLDRAGTAGAVRAIAEEIRRVRPQVVVTFGADGSYGHPDHIAISQYAGAAIVLAASATDILDSGAPHAVSKFYWMAWSAGLWARYQAGIKVLTSKVDGVSRAATAWPDWAITTRVDASDHWQAVRNAVRCHATQTAGYGRLQELTDAEHRDLWGTQEFYRVFSTVEVGPGRETDLFAGLR